ncbi:MAG: IPExxxVDY family protein [Bacteroidota bacterium]
MKKYQLDNYFKVNFELFGLVCNKKEYKLAWYLNQVLGFNLVKQDDIKIEFSDRSFILISNYLHQTEHIKMELLHNKLECSTNFRHNYVIPELNQIDYLIKFSDNSEEMSFEDVHVIIKQIPIVEYVMRLNFDVLKSKENLLY